MKSYKDYLKDEHTKYLINKRGLAEGTRQAIADIANAGKYLIAFDASTRRKLKLYKADIDIWEKVRPTK